MGRQNPRGWAYRARLLLPDVPSEGTLTPYLIPATFCPGNRSSLSRGRDFSSSSAAGDRGTRCSFPFFVLALKSSRFPALTSLHVGGRVSPLLMAVSMTHSRQLA